MNQIKLLVLDDYEGVLAQSPAMNKMRQLADVTVFDHPLTSNDYDRLKEFQVIFALRERTKMDVRFFDTCSSLELVLQSGGHAYHIDQNAATQRGIVIALGRRTTRPMLVVSELTLGLMIGLVRQIYPLNAEMAKGNWPTSIGGTLAGRTLGILGFGRHGRPVARLAQAFGMKVIAWERTGNYTKDESGVQRVSLDDLLAQSDIVSIHLKLSDESKGLLNRERIAKMKPGAFLVNTSRGAIVDESALIDALRENRLAGAGLDVFETEPLPTSSPLRTLPNVLLTPHVGWKVRDVLEEFVEIAAEQLDEWLINRLAPSDVMNPPALKVSRERNGGIEIIKS
jgi:phosphoglycerate dehydrogenase-like enzyme